MKILFNNASLIRMFFLVTGLILLYCCSTNEDDMRQKTVNELGDPDEIATGGYGVDVYQIYYYDNTNIDRVYVYRKSASGCGSSGNWYIYNTYMASWLDRTMYTPPKIVHTPVKSSPAGKSILITATITDDSYVKNAIVYYCVLGDTTFLPVTMGLVDSTLYSADIPAESVTTKGVSYYLVANDASHSSRLPSPKGTYTINVTEGAARVVGRPDTTQTPSPLKITPSNRERLNITQ